MLPAAGCESHSFASAFVRCRPVRWYFSPGCDTFLPPHFPFFFTVYKAFNGLNHERVRGCAGGTPQGSASVFPVHREFLYWSIMPAAVAVFAWNLLLKTAQIRFGFWVNPLQLRPVRVNAYLCRGIHQRLLSNF